MKSAFRPDFQRTFSKIKDRALREKIIKQLEKIRENPEVGKPMRNVRKGTRELHISPFRLSYAYFKDEGKIVLLDLYHKDDQ